MNIIIWLILLTTSLPWMRLATHVRRRCLLSTPRLDQNHAQYQHFLLAVLLSMSGISVCFGLCQQIHYTRCFVKSTDVCNVNDRVGCNTSLDSLLDSLSNVWFSFLPSFRRRTPSRSWPSLLFVTLRCSPSTLSCESESECHNHFQGDRTTQMWFINLHTEIHVLGFVYLCLFSS